MVKIWIVANKRSARRRIDAVRVDRGIYEMRGGVCEIRQTQVDGRMMGLGCVEPCTATREGFLCSRDSACALTVSKRRAAEQPGDANTVRERTGMEIAERTVHADSPGSISSSDEYPEDHRLMPKGKEYSNWDHVARWMAGPLDGIHYDMSRREVDDGQNRGKSLDDEMIFQLGRSADTRLLTQHHGSWLPSGYSAVYTLAYSIAYSGYLATVDQRMRHDSTSPFFGLGQPSCLVPACRRVISGRHPTQSSLPTPPCPSMQGSGFHMLCPSFWFDSTTSPPLIPSIIEVATSTSSQQAHAKSCMYDAPPRTNCAQLSGLFRTSAGDWSLHPRGDFLLTSIATSSSPPRSRKSYGNSELPTSPRFAEPLRWLCFWSNHERLGRCRPTVANRDRSMDAVAIMTWTSVEKFIGLQDEAALAQLEALYSTWPSSQLPFSHQSLRKLKTRLLLQSVPLQVECVSQFAAIGRPSMTQIRHQNGRKFDSARHCVDDLRNVLDGTQLDNVLPRERRARARGSHCIAGSGQQRQIFSDTREALANGLSRREREESRTQMPAYLASPPVRSEQHRPRYEGNPAKDEALEQPNRKTDLHTSAPFLPSQREAGSIGGAKQKPEKITYYYDGTRDKRGHARSEGRERGERGEAKRRERSDGNSATEDGRSETRQPRVETGRDKTRNISQECTEERHKAYGIIPRALRPAGTGSAQQSRAHLRSLRTQKQTELNGNEDLECRKKLIERSAGSIVHQSNPFIENQTSLTRRLDRNLTAQIRSPACLLTPSSRGAGSVPQHNPSPAAATRSPSTSNNCRHEQRQERTTDERGCQTASSEDPRRRRCSQLRGWRTKREEGGKRGGQSTIERTQPAVGLAGQARLEFMRSKGRLQRDEEGQLFSHFSCACALYEAQNSVAYREQSSSIGVVNHPAVRLRTSPAAKELCAVSCSSFLSPILRPSMNPMHLGIQAGETFSDLVDDVGDHSGIQLIGKAFRRSTGLCDVIPRLTFAFCSDLWYWNWATVTTMPVVPTFGGTFKRLPATRLTQSQSGKGFLGFYGQAFANCSTSEIGLRMLEGLPNVRWNTNRRMQCVLRVDVTEAPPVLHVRAQVEVRRGCDH
ncbi:hypothetical protein BV25DRAFT_1843367 [Artomyces pyxidatus]|uniref:Uncharacterized protein n=1 Tax=Artomyces pyxidatus TaxID=48021 RepID=A0ACB8SG00_9AGAM|nr:hypothetical protein BV25DRAFT_1843367 [Artomyces pyxidatus]